MSLIIPHSFVAGNKAKAAEVNENFTAIEDWAAAVPVADLEDGTSGQIIVCNSSGVPTYRTVGAGSEVLISNTGVFTLNQEYRHHDQTSDKSLVPGAVAGMTSAALDSGIWLVYAKIEVETTSGGGLTSPAIFQVEKSAVTGLAQFKVQPTSSNDSACGSTMTAVESGGSDTVRLTLTNTPGGTLNGVGVRGVLFAWKLQ